MDPTQILLDLARQNAQHIEVLNREVATVIAQVDFLTKFFFIIMTASIGAAVASVWSLILHKNKRRK